MKNFKLNRTPIDIGVMKKFKLFKMLAVLVVLITSINTAWAERGWRATGMWQIWGWKTNYENNGWITNNGNLFNSDEDCSLGVLTESSDSYWFSGIAAKTYGTEVDGVKCYWVLPGGSNGNNNLGTNDSGHDRYWEYKTMWDYSINKNAAPGDYTIDLYFKIVAGGNEYSENHRKITWTIPGFKTDNPTEFDFGSNSPINKKSVAKIGVVHYGDYPNLGGCVLSGDDKDYFEVIDIDYSGVTVMFKPTAAGVEKTATLTITDTYSKTWTVSLRGTGAANTTTTRMYFNDKTNQGDWQASGALYRFTCEYTTGVYTWFPMELCENSEYNYYADVELKSVTPTVDRYNPSSPYTTWNYVTPSLSSSNNVAVSTGKYTAYATSLPFNEISGGHVYYDNSESNFSNTLYWVIGHEYERASGSPSVYSKTISPSPATPTPITNTKLSYYDLSEESWPDASYYAVIGTDASSATISGWGTGWGRSDLSTKGTGGYTAAYETPLDLVSGQVYMANAASSGGAMTITKRASSDASALNSTQAIKYALSTDNGAHYNDMSNGNTPGQISISAYKFVDETYNSVTNSENTATITSNSTGTYSTSVPAAYTGKTTLSASARDGYTFVDWNGSATTLNPKAAATYTARFKANQYTLSFNDEGATTAGGNSDRTVTFEQSTNLGTVTCPQKEGYEFNGYWTTASGAGVQVFDENGSLISTASGYTSSGKWVCFSGNVELHARWNDDGIYYFSGAESSDWTDEDNWTKGAVPSAVTDQVRLLADATIPTGTTVKVASVDIATSGSYTPNGAEAISANGHLTISRGAALIASGTVQVNAAPGFSSAANTTSEDLLIRSDEYDPSGKTHTTNGTGTLIMGSNDGNTGATVEMFTLACYKEGVGETDEERFVNQFVGTPFNDETSVGNYNYDGYQLYQFCPAQDGTYGGTNTWWNKLAASDGMTPFYGYNLMSYGHKTPSTLSMSGTLVSNDNKVLDLYYSASNKENLFANPWTAPIDIKAFETSDFGGGKATIYIFNAGTPSEQANYDMDEEGAANATNPGQYIVLPIASSTWEGATALTQIPSMQAFSVFSTAASQKLTLNYTKLVSTPAATNAIQPYMRAPKRVEGQPETIRIRVSEENGWADKINIYIREDFTTGFDNGYDGDRISGEPEAPELYSMSDEGPMTVNCISDAEGTVVGFRKGSANTAYTMNFEYLGENTWYLNDTKKETSTLISEDNSYSFDATANDGARFVISKSPIQKVPTGVDEISDSSKARKQMIDGTLYIIRDGRIYNAEGSLVK